MHRVVDLRTVRLALLSVAAPETAFEVLALSCREELGMDEDAPGLSYAAARLWRMAFPNIKVTRPAARIHIARDVAVPLSDGTLLRANGFGPDYSGRFPVLMSAHPYGKDVLPRRTPPGYLPLARYRFVRQPDAISYSAYTAWEAPESIGHFTCATGRSPSRRDGSSLSRSSCCPLRHCFAVETCCASM